MADINIEENVRNLVISKTDNEDNLKNNNRRLYRSIYRKQNSCKNVSLHATMGPPQEDNYCNFPKEFLKKGAGYKILQNRNKSGGGNACLLSTVKASLPYFNDIDNTKNSGKNQKTDYVRRNIMNVDHKTSFVNRPYFVQDTRNGHRQILDSSGLQPKFVFKNDYGKLPSYMAKKYHREKNRAKFSAELNGRKDLFSEKSQTGNIKERIIPDEERTILLNGLKQNLLTLEKEYQLLPFVTDTLSKRNRKLFLENKMKNLEENIKILENNSHVIVLKNSNTS